MADTVSPATGRRYGAERVCKVWGLPRSSYYAARRVEDGQPAPRSKGRRGPKPGVSDADLLAAIRADLKRSPWSGEGHRKSGRGCGCWMGFVPPASGCCG
jgi:hypothetical protein